MSTATTHSIKPRRNYKELDERRKAKAMVELADIAELHRAKVEQLTISQNAAAVLMRCSTKTLETNRKYGKAESSCAVVPFAEKLRKFEAESGKRLADLDYETEQKVRREVLGGRNQMVHYFYDCLLKIKESQRPEETVVFGGPFNARSGTLGFMTFEEVVQFDEPWVTDENGWIVEHALVVSDEVLDAAIDDDRIFEGTLADALLLDTWADVDVRRVYEAALTEGLQEALRRTKRITDKQAMSAALSGGRDLPPGGRKSPI